jgi:DNA-binding winged helix-turn-helix (wHTH) protein
LSQPLLHIRFGRFELDEGRHLLLADGVAVAIGPKPLALLFHLARHRDRVVRKEELLRAAWPGVVVTDDAVSQVVMKAREALGEVGARARILETVRGVGFRFGAEAEALGANVPASAGAHDLFARGPRARDRDAAIRSRAGGLRRRRPCPRDGRSRHREDAARLAEELATIAEDAGTDVHRARAQDAAGTPAFWLWAQVLRACAESWDVERLRDTLASGATDLARIAPLLRERLVLAPPTLGDTGEMRFRLYDALARFLKRAARGRPQVLVLDDLQWMDADSLRTLGHLAGELRRERVLVVVTVRGA